MATRQLVVALVSDSSGFSKGFRDAEGTMQKFDGKVSAVTTSVGKLGSALTAALGAAAVGSFARDAVRAFSDLEESINAVNVTFREGATQITEFGKRAASTVGLSNAQFNQLSVTLGALLTNVGFTAGDAADETIRLTERAADLASVFNTDVGDALFAIQAALRGETEPIRRYGINLSAAAIEAEALGSGLASSKKDLDANGKAVAALNLIYAQSNQAAGDFKNTSDGLANSQRILAAEFEDTKARIGEGLAPVAADLLGVAKDLIPVIEDLGGALTDFAELAGGVITGLADGIQGINDFGDRIGNDGLAGDLIVSAVAFKALLKLFPSLATAIGSIPASFSIPFAAAGVAGAAGIGLIVDDFKRISENAEQAAIATGNYTPRLFELTKQISAYQGVNEDVARQRAEIELGFIEQAEAAQRELRVIESINNANSDRVGILAGAFDPADTALVEDTTTALQRLQAQFDVTNSEEAQAAIDELAGSFAKTITVFDEAPEEIDVSLSEMLANIQGRADQLARLSESLAVLSAAGLDALVADLVAQGPAVAGAAEELAANLPEAFEINEELERAAENSVDAANAALGRKIPSLANQFYSYGIELARALEFGFSNLDLTVPAPSSGGGGGRSTPPPSGDANIDDPRFSAVRAFGGPVNAGESYLVGERGQELFVPNQNGRILSNRELSGLSTGGSTVNVTVNNPQVGRTIDQDIQRGLLLAGVSRTVEVS